MNPFDIVNIIGDKSSHDKDEVLANYNAWIINHCLSNIQTTIFYAAEMAKYLHLPKEAQFDFYFNAIPKGKYFGKWNKEDKSQDELINNLCVQLSINRTLAKCYLKLLSDEQKQQIINCEGGK